MTSKRQVTIPKSIAVQYGIDAGDQIDFQPAGEAIRVLPRARPEATPAEGLARFDRATERQRAREAARGHAGSADAAADRGWTRAEMYTRRGSG